jgi:hypothetical protein
MQYLNEIIWYISWPILLILSVKFVQLNLKHFKKMERLEELEALHAKKSVE